MASEAQRLIGISLTKIAQSRAHRGGVSLHKNLLVATVLQKARYIFMEEAYNMVHYQPPAPVQPRQVPEQELVGLTAEEAGVPEEPSSGNFGGSVSGGMQDFQGCAKCAENQNKENQPPQTSSELTYLDLDKSSSNVLRERSNSCLKRRRAVAEWETEEAVQSILPKRTKSECGGDDADDVFLDDATSLSDAVSRELEHDAAPSASTTTTTAAAPKDTPAAMEIDRITSLVSIFSFSMTSSASSSGDNPKLNRSMSTPDLCSAQAKEPGEPMQRPFLAMTV